MKYTKAVQCDYCGNLELSISKKKFESWFKFLGWIQTINGNITTHEFCSDECFKKDKEETLIQAKAFNTL